MDSRLTHDEFNMAHFASRLLTAISRSIWADIPRGISAGSLIIMSASSSGGSSIGSSEGWMPGIQNFAKFVDLEALAALSFPGAPDPNLGHSQIKV